jgi:serine protease Do
VPTELAVNVVNQLKEFGETRRGWLGVRIQPVTDDIAESLKMEMPRGALVSGIIEGGPITKGEIKPGDVIVRFDGMDVAEIRDLMRAVGESPVGKAVDVVIIRDGKEQTVRVTLGRLEDGEHLAARQTEPPNGEGAKPGEPPAAQLPASDTVLGMKLAVLDADRRKSFGIAEEVKGVVVTEVQPNSPAAERRLEAGDVIVEVGQEAMKTPEEITARVEELKADGRRNALLMIASKTGELRFVTVRME